MEKKPDEKGPAGKVVHEPPKIEVSRNGPYLVTGGVPLAEGIIANDEQGYSHHWRKGPVYPLRESYALCRCGRSISKPFCDGYHEKTGFDGTETASRDPYIARAEKIEGPDLTLTDYPDLCASAKFCDRAGGIWNLTRQSEDPAARKIAITESENCPSGRLVTWERGTGTALEPELLRSISLVEYSATGMPGPIWLRGGIPVISASGEAYEVRNRQTLCRCGRSENKPFCDSSHLDAAEKTPGE